jgi:GBP family porin
MKMQPTLAALMTMGLAATAHAQSSVTVFGLLDLNVSHYKSGSVANAGSVTLMQDGTTNGLNGSRWGIRTTEDLGGGLKAGAWLEGGLNADTGAAAQGGRAFGRQVFVSLSHTAAGELRLGRQYILSDSVVGQGNPFGNALVNNPTTSVTNMGRNLPMWLNAPRADNTIQLQTANLAGFHAAVQVAPGEGTADRFHGVRFVYQAGPLYTGLAYEWNKARSDGENTNKSLSATANYNFGFMKLLGGIQRNSDLRLASNNGAAVGVSNLIVTGATSFTAQDIDGWTLGAEVPLGGPTTLGVNYTQMNYEGTGGEAKLGKAAVTGRYGFSKNTFGYAGVSTATGDLKDYISQKTVFQLGLRMAF